MDRLTIEYCGEYVPKDMCSIDRLGGADDCDLCYEYCKATEEGNEDCRECAISKCFNKLGEYEDLEEQGKLLKLPCAVGDTAWIVFEGEIFKCMVSKFDIVINGIFPMLRINETLKTISVSMKTLEKTWFLTKEEAEAALKELERGKGE